MQPLNKKLSEINSKLSQIKKHEKSLKTAHDMLKYKYTEKSLGKIKFGEKPKFPDTQYPWPSFDKFPKFDSKVLKKDP